MTTMLDLNDVQKLQQDPSSETRLEIAHKVCTIYNDRENLRYNLSASEIKLSEEVLRLLARDAEHRVRMLLAQQLKENSYIPHDIALKLAHDLEDVAAPMLEFSMVLTEYDLMEIIKSTHEAFIHQAIARRESVSSNLSHDLLYTRQEQTINTLLSNEGAYIDARDLEWVAAQFRQCDDIMQALVMRGDLPLTLAERMVSLVSDVLRQKLVAHYGLSMRAAEDLAQGTREWALLELVGVRRESYSLTELIDTLFKQKKLSSSLVLRALCLGDLDFFTAALAKRARISPENAEKLIFDISGLGFQALYAQARMPHSLAQAVALILKLAMDMATGRSSGKSGGHWLDASEFRTCMIEKILEGGYDSSVSNMGYFIAIMNNPPSYGAAMKQPPASLEQVASA